MKEIFSISGIDIFQRNLNQIVIRSKGDGDLNETIKKETSFDLPSENLKLVSNDQFLLAKHSFDQWNIIYLKDQKHLSILDFVKNLNSNNEDILASDFSFGQSYFIISGDKKNFYLNKLTHFDFRSKKFPVNSMAQTLVARIECSIYHLKDKYIISCNKSFENYFKERLIDSINI